MPEWPAGTRDPADRLRRPCDSCGVIDDHPRHIHLGGNGDLVRFRHFDCCHHGGCPATDNSPAGAICSTVVTVTRRARGDDLTAWLEGRMAALGGDLTAWLQRGAPQAGGSGLDQNRVIDILNVITGYSASASTPYQGVLVNPFSASSSQLGHVRLMTANGSSTANGTELASSGSYVAGTGINYTTGPSGSFAGAVYGTGSGTAQTSATLPQAGMPATTINGMETWDSKGTAPAYSTSLRWAWGALASAVTTNSGDTLSFGSGAVLATLLA